MGELKSPNIVLDKKYTIKVCDFGLSCSSTFLSIKSTAGSPEWMASAAPCEEPSNEKSDVYSFGVKLWEIAWNSTFCWSGRKPLALLLLPVLLYPTNTWE